MVAFEILARYEALFRSAGFHPGEVTSSSLAALELYQESGVVVIAKLAGNVVTIMAIADGRLKLFRCLELDAVTDEELLGVLHPTFAYVEDELLQPVSKLLLCGFGRPPEGISVPTEPLRSSTGCRQRIQRGPHGLLGGSAMMRAPINLSTEPFRHDRAAIVVSTVCSILLVGLLGVQVFLILGERSRAAESRDAVNKLQTQLSAASVDSRPRPTRSCVNR